jgi:hypothetical protein
MAAVAPTVAAASTAAADITDRPTQLLARKPPRFDPVENSLPASRRASIPLKIPYPQGAALRSRRRVLARRPLFSLLLEERLAGKAPTIVVFKPGFLTRPGWRRPSERTLPASFGRSNRPARPCWQAFAAASCSSCLPGKA